MILAKMNNNRQKNDYVNLIYYSLKNIVVTFIF